MRTAPALLFTVVLVAAAERVAARGDIGDDIGACCLATPGGGYACEPLTESECAAFAAVFNGPGSTCTDAVCARGACCTEGPGALCLDALAIECAAAGGTFAGPDVACSTGACTCAGDVNGDAAVDVFDLLEVVFDWGCAPGPIPCPGDATGDGFVDVADLVAVIVAWGSCGG